MVLKTSWRYAFSRKNRHFSRSVRIAVTLALSVSILMTVISVMHALQDKRFEDIRRIKSFDIIAETEDVERVKELYPECSVFLYYEEMVLSGESSYEVRYIDLETYDGGITPMAGGGDILVGYDYYAENGLGELIVTRLGEGVGKLPKSVAFQPTGIFTSGIRSFDRDHMFLPIESRGKFAEPRVGIKGSDDKTLLTENGIEAKTWKESESTLYSAFLLENFMMKTVLSILFLIVVISQRQSVELFLVSKRKERAEFAVLGLSRTKVRTVFISSFLIIAFTGLIGGLLLSFLVIPVFSRIIAMTTDTVFHLVLDWSLYFTVSAVMILLTVLITLFYLGREEKREITEVIHG